MLDTTHLDSVKEEVFLFPTKDKLELLIKEGFSNKQIAFKYDTSYQKITKLILDYEIKTAKYRKNDKYITYIHRNKGKPVYVGSGRHDRISKISGRKNSHKKLMRSGKLSYEIHEVFDTLDQARQKEYDLIREFKEKGHELFNTDYGTKGTNHKRYEYRKLDNRSPGREIVVHRNGLFHGEYSHIILFAEELNQDKPERLLSGISKIINHSWRPKKGMLAGYEVKYK